MSSSGGEAPKIIYLFNCPFGEKDNAKRAGAKWDATEGRWFVPFTPQQQSSLEPFNRWHPNGWKYLECSYEEKDDAKHAGARWDKSCKQWYIDVNKDESKFLRWLPSLSKLGSIPKSTKASTKKPSPKSKTASDIERPSKKRIQLAKISRINDDMTIPQLQDECRARDPSIKGLSNKNKTWLLDHLQVGTPWISSSSAVSSANQQPKSTTGKSDKQGTKKKGSTVHKKQTSEKNNDNNKQTTKKIKKDPPSTNKPPKQQTKQAQKDIPQINDDMTVVQLQNECRARDPNIKGLSNKNKSWLIDHLVVGTPWISLYMANQSPSSGSKSKPSSKSDQETKDKVSTVPKQANKDDDKKKQSKSGSSTSSSVGSKNRAADKNNNQDKPIINKIKKEPTATKEASKQTKETKQDTKVKIALSKSELVTLNYKVINNSKPKAKDNKNTPITKKIKKEPTATTEASKQIKETKQDTKVKIALSKTELVTSNNKVINNSKPKAKDSKNNIKSVNTQTKKLTPKVMATSNDAKTVAVEKISSNIGSYSRITNKMTLEKLREEAKARQLDAKITPKIKIDLLRVLVDGSICIHESAEYHTYQVLLDRVKRERSELEEASPKKEAAAEARKGELRLQRSAKLEREDEAEQQRKKEQRLGEISGQVTLHTHSFPWVHCHALARYSNIKKDGVPRDASCDCCYTKRSGMFFTYLAQAPCTPLYSCDKCDWDICLSCLDKANKIKAEKELIKKER